MKDRLPRFITFFGCFQFILVTTLAAFLYPGGYKYFGYYLSDLGRSVAINGDINPLSSALFSLTLVILGFTLIPFWIRIQMISSLKKKANILKKLGSLLGLLAMMFSVGIAFTPVDIYPIPHRLINLTYRPSQ